MKTVSPMRTTLCAGSSASESRALDLGGGQHVRAHGVEVGEAHGQADEAVRPTLVMALAKCRRPLLTGHRKTL